MTENKDFKIVNNDLHPEHYSLQLLCGDFKDVQWCYGDIRFVEEDDQARVSFRFKIENPGDHTVESLNDSAAFKNQISEVLDTILNNYEYTTGNDSKP